MDGATDLLLINASNFSGQAIFPYAFVQVSAVARHHGRTVRRLELLPFARERWRAEIAHAIQTHRPRLVGVHLRQVDSQFVAEYVPTPGRRDPLRTYMPAERTREVLAIVRELTDAPTILGGFGFTAQAPILIERLQPDFAIQGEPDALFAHFDRVLAARSPDELDDIANLVHRDGATYRFNRREFFPPLDAPEYTDEIFGELTSFYAALGRSLGVGELGEADLAVEIMRGCPAACYFCTEPSVKGKRLRHRDLDAVMADVAFLGARHVRSVFFICSELNLGGMDHAMELAARMQHYNDARPGREMLWRAYAMPRPGMTRAQLTTMMRAGYRPGWNEFLSFEDTNLKRARMPYRTADAIRYYRDILELAADPTIYRGPRQTKLEMFLGNAFADASTIRETIRVVDEQGFAMRHAVGGAITATRVYDLAGTLTCGTPDTVFSVNEQGRQAMDTGLPSYHYAPALLAALGSEAAVEEFLRFVGATFLSTQHRATATYARFLLGAATVEGFAALLRACLEGPLWAQLSAGGAMSPLRAEAKAQAARVWADPTPAALIPWFAPRPDELPLAELTLAELVRVLLFLDRDAFAPVLAFLGLPAARDPTHAQLTPYRVMRTLYPRFDSTEALVAACREQGLVAPGTVTDLHLTHFLYSHNVVIRPAYRELLF